MSDEITQKIRAIIAAQALIEPDDLDDSASLETLGLDSLALLEVVFAIEEQFGISIPFNANDSAGQSFDTSSVGGMIEAFRGLIAKSA